MLSRAIKYLEEKHTCPHCRSDLTLCHAPPVHVGDGLGWGSEYLFICLNDECPLFENGWQNIEDNYGHAGSYRHMEIPNSSESYNMMVASENAFKGSEVNIEALFGQNEKFQKQKQALAELENCVQNENLEPALYISLDDSAKLDDRKKAIECLVTLNDLSCIEPLRNHEFKDSYLEQGVNMAIRKILASNFVKECPYCAELVKTRAKICKHCLKEL